MCSASGFRILVAAKFELFPVPPGCGSTHVKSVLVQREVEFARIASTEVRFLGFMRRLAGSIQQLTHSDAVTQDPAWSPDGSRILQCNTAETKRDLCC